MVLSLFLCSGDGMVFKKAEKTYQDLIRQYQAGQISDAEFTVAVQNLRVQTPDGVWWQIRGSDGTWLKWDGSTWLESEYTALPPTKARAKRNPIITCLAVMGVLACGLVCLLATVGGGGYYAISTGSLNQRTILNAVGLGTGDITIINIVDDSLETRLVRLDTESGSPETVDSEEIAPFEISGYGAIQPGEYEIQISSPSGIPAGGICRLTIASGDSFQFVAVPDGIAVTKEGQAAESADDLDMSTTGLCR
jgi:hypothetical protein